MKILTNTKSTLALFIVVSMMFSCGKDKDNEIEPATVESSKNRMLDDGLVATETMNRLKNDEFMLSLINFSDLNSDKEEFIEQIFVSKIIEASNSGDFQSLTLAQRKLNDEGPETLEDLWDETIGTYTYNFQTDEFDFKIGGNSIIVLFPAADDATTNSAKLTISNFTSVAPKTDIYSKDDGYTGNLPTGIAVSLAIDGTVGMTVSASAEYDDQDLPVKMDTKVTVSDFSIAVNYENTGSKVSYGTSFKEGSSNILSNSMSVLGNVSYQDLIDIDENEGDFSDLELTDATFTSQIMNTKVEVIIADANAFFKDIDALPEEPSDEQKENTLNDNISANITFADTNQKVGDVAIEIDIDGELDFIMTYDDGTKISVADFIASGFEDLEDELNELFN